MSWGRLLSAARTNFSAWWVALFPGLAIFVTVLVFNRLGEGISTLMEEFWAQILRLFRKTMLVIQLRPLE